ncbi:PREDICTED: probable ATP-dependent RNA helicase DDX28 [Haliaeetus leucocephalus]|uniref:probable ATP-dependent RNA helicase DDX28 n=1 Tax=Haliaeetus leucocephalus TaxID=52644 RepID=UPI00053CB36D|nr:PREDICTED: probable ATP-dependent RNA helicase DDX28 [Haliaeetus leucocephalus]
MALSRGGMAAPLPLLLPRRLAAGAEPPANVVRVPWALRLRLQRGAQRRRRGQKEAAAAAAQPGKLLLRSRRPELSQPRWQTVGRWERPQLVSAGWKHRKACGDYFQLEPSQEAAPALQLGTPGALRAALRRRFLALGRLRWMVLDEADALMDDSFSEALEEILAHAPLAAGAPGPAGPGEARTQVVVVGATFPAGLSQTLGKFTDVGRFVILATQSLHRLPPHVQQKFVRLKGRDKLPELLQLLKERPASGGAVLVFCNSASTVNWLGYILDDHKIKHLRLQGQMSAAARAGIFASFQKGDVSVLVCTDLASRGLDTGSVQLVVNYDFPDTLQDYLHRVGRVGRVGSKAPGAVVSFVTHRWDVDLVRKIETAARKRTGLPGMDSSINKPPPKGG